MEVKIQERAVHEATTECLGRDLTHFFCPLPVMVALTRRGAKVVLPEVCHLMGEDRKRLSRLPRRQAFLKERSVWYNCSRGWSYRAGKCCDLCYGNSLGSCAQSTSSDVFHPYMCNV